MSGRELSDTKRELLARLLAGKAAPVTRRVPAADPDRRVRLSYAQERVWLTAQLAPDMPVFHLVMVATLPLRVEAEPMELNLRDVMVRHDCLRMSVDVVDGEPLIVVHDPDDIEVRIPVTDLSDAPDPYAAAVAHAEEVARRPYRLDTAPLWRAEVIWLGPDSSLLLFATHHLIADATSLNLIGLELAGRGQPELPVSYRDFAAWQRDGMEAGELDASLAFWRTELAGVPTSLELPTDRPRPPLPDLSGRTLQLDIPEETTARLRALSKAEGVTPYVLHLAALGVLIGRYTHRRDILVGTYLAGRGEPELQKLVGMFVNLVPVRVRMTGTPTFRQLADRVRTAAAGTFAHQTVPFEQLVRQTPRGVSRSEPPLVQLGFNMLRLSGDAVDLPISQDVSQLDLTVHVVERADGTHNLMLEYATTLFDAATVEQLGRHYLNLLDLLGREPDTPIARIGALTPAEQAALTTDRAAPVTDRTVPVTDPADAAAEPPLLADAIAERVRARPDAVAVSAGDTTLTYRELDELAGRLADRLRARGAGPEHVVGVCLERGLPLVVGLLAIWRAGAAYLPLDPEHPPARWAATLADAGAELVITDPGREARLTALGVAAPLVLAQDGTSPGQDGTEPAHDGTARSGQPGPPSHRDGAAYVLFTSGSTGTPKGVVITNAGIANRVWWTVRTHKLTEHDRVLQKTRIGFDAAGWEVFAPLVVGGTVVLAPPGVERDPAALVRAVADEDVTVLQVVPSVLRLLLEQPGWVECVALRLLFSAGEPLDAELCARVRETGSPEIWNTYGPTECSIDVTAHRFDARQRTGTVPIGEPIDHTRITLVGPDGELVPDTVPGELLVGGPGVARGYAGRPDLTAERFVPDPYGPPGSRVYRTGDLVRRDREGVLHFAGRADDQIKVNGVRIEPAEINTALLRHPEITAAYTLAEPGRRGERRLVAHVVAGPGRAPGTAELRSWLAALLPTAMIPAVFVPHTELPLGENGKVDRSALPAADDRHLSGPTHIAPRTAAERLVAEVWSELLDRDRIGADDDFFALGGHSLLLARLAAGLTDRAGVPIAVHSLFGSLRLADQAALISAGGSATDAPPPIRPAARQPGDGPGLPLSSGQRRLWFLDQLNPHSPEYVLPVAIPLRGRAELPALRAALTDLAARHEILRTHYTRHDGEPRQIVSPVGGGVLEVADGPLETVIETLGDRIRQGFRLADGTSWRALLLRAAEPGHDDVLMLLLHHIAADGLSVPVLRRDLTELYRARVDGDRPALPELAVQYADFAAWQNDWLSGERIEGELDFWRERLAGMPYLALPTDRPRPPVRDASGAVVGFRIPADAAGPLVAAGRERGASEFMSLLALFTVLLGRYSGQRDIAVGAPVAGRARPELDDLVGFFVNTLVLRNDLSGEPTVGELLDRVRAGALDAFAHPYLPFERLVDELSPERDLSRTPLVSVLFDVADVGAPSDDTPGAAGPAVELDQRFAGLWQAAKFDQTWTLRAEPDGSYVGTVEYATALFHADTVRAMTGHFVQLLRGARDPGSPVSELELLAPRERAALTAREPERSAPPILPTLIAERAAATPDAVAATEVGPDGRSLSYGELLDRSGRLANHLRAGGIGPGDVLGVALPRGLDLLVGVVAAWRAGAAFLPLDATHPPKRLIAQCLDAGVAAVLTAGGLIGADLPGMATVDIVADAGAVAARPATTPPVPLTAADAAYVMFTSGSTGRPKGVVVGHGAIANRVAWSVSGQGIGPTDRILHKTRFGFDAAVLELFAPLAAGGTVVMAAPDTELDPAALLRAAGDGAATVLQLVPSVLRTLLELPEWPELPALRQVWLAGEPLTAELAAALRERVDVQVWNTYGPTECAIDVTAYAVGTGPTAGPVPIGRPLPRLWTRVLDHAGRLAPPGVPGELLVGGAGLARGYAGRPELTAERFVPDPYGPPGARLYRTGDLVRRRADGVLEFVGRVDSQVKVNGVRIEPGEIEAALTGHPSVRDAVVIARELASGGRTLVAYYLPGTEPADGTRQVPTPTDPTPADPTAAELARHCRRSLPQALVPGVFVALDAFPLNRNGKLDRAALPDPAAVTRTGAPETAPHGPVEERIAELWGELLDRAPGSVGADTSFFALGGNSLLAIRLVSALQREFDLELPVRVVFEGPSVAELAAAVEAAIRAEIDALPDDELAAEAALLAGEPHGESPNT
ncbi:amino acid adenylation domain-containing protein [Streptomyces sp. NPDC020965]|uniref:amino acid adenylation domain-containing protein n=1 Tax=Streptomyces sp. NPDC020965 TaxID=3365105 RepID=UPI0037A3669A